MERAYDAAKYGWYSDRPFIDGAMQSMLDPDMAPPGKHVLSCFVQYSPYDLRKDGKSVDWETEKENFGDKTQAVLEEHFPGFGKLVLQREIVTPADIERVTGLSEGNIFAGEFLAPQMYFFRPSPGWSQYATRSTATTSAAPAPTRAAASSARPASSRASGSCGTRPARADADGHLDQQPKR